MSKAGTARTSCPSLGLFPLQVHAFKRMIQPNQPAIGQRSAPLSYEERGAMLGEVPLPGTAAAAAAAGAQQAQQGSQSLARNLLAVAEADRQRIQVGPHIARACAVCCRSLACA